MLSGLDTTKQEVLVIYFLKPEKHDHKNCHIHVYLYNNISFLANLSYIKGSIYLKSDREQSCNFISQGRKDNF